MNRVLAAIIEQLVYFMEYSIVKMIIHECKNYCSTLKIHE